MSKVRQTGFTPDDELLTLLAGKKLGEGTYAIVYKGHLRSDPHKLVAIKKFKGND